MTRFLINHTIFSIFYYREILNTIPMWQRDEHFYNDLEDDFEDDFEEMYAIGIKRETTKSIAMLEEKAIGVMLEYVRLRIDNDQLKEKLEALREKDKRSREEKKRLIEERNRLIEERNRLIEERQRLEDEEKRLAKKFPGQYEDEKK